MTAAAGALAFKLTITLKEIFLQFAGVTAVMLLGFFIARHYGITDIEHWHGRVTGKPHGSQKCCHCHDVCERRDKNGRCMKSREVCTHSTDHWWSLDTTVGRIQVDDCGSTYAPPDLWVRARVGEPATIENRYVNYMKADPESLFVRDVESPY